MLAIGEMSIAHTQTQGIFKVMWWHAIHVYKHKYSLDLLGVGFA